MPAKSKAQRVVAAIAEHHPEQLYERNKGMASMTMGQLHEFAATSTKNLPQRVKSTKPHQHIHNLKHFAHPPKGKK